MSLLTACQYAMREIGVSPPSSIVGSSEELSLLLEALLYRVGDELRNAHLWPELTKLHTITVAASTTGYALPADLDYRIFDTDWNRSETLPMVGPVSPQVWRAIEEGDISAAPYTRHRVMGHADNNYIISPSPGAGDAGNILVFEYQSTQWFKPVAWTSGTAFDANSYCFYNGNTYKTTGGGTTGATAPTHTEGSASDDAVNWTFQETYETFTADTDEFLLDQKLIELGLQWLFKESKGFRGVGKLEKRFWNSADLKISSKRGAKTESLAGNGGYRFLSRFNIPQSGFGA